MRALSLLLVAAISVAHPLARPTAAPLEQINANENRVTAGSLKDGVLTVHLELRRGTWYPDDRRTKGWTCSRSEKRAGRCKFLDRFCVLPKER